MSRRRFFRLIAIAGCSCLLPACSKRLSERDQKLVQALLEGCFKGAYIGGEVDPATEREWIDWVVENMEDSGLFKVSYRKVELGTRSVSDSKKGSAFDVFVLSSGDKMSGYRIENNELGRVVSVPEDAQGTAVAQYVFHVRRD